MKEHKIIIDTPEKIRFTYTISQVGRRMTAYSIDILCQLLILIFLGFLLGFGSLFSSITKDSNHMAVIAFGFYLLIIFFLRWFYFVLNEVTTEGQSIGKKMMHLRVIKTDGSGLDFETIVLRNFLRVVDDFPIFAILGGFIVLFDKKSRRLGDLVVGTVVVDEIYFKLKEPDFKVHFTTLQNGPLMDLHKKLNENELYIIRRFLNESYTLPLNKKKEVADKLAKQIKEKLGVAKEIGNPVKFLEEIYRSHAIYN